MQHQFLRIGHSAILFCSLSDTHQNPPNLSRSFLTYSILIPYLYFIYTLFILFKNSINKV